MTAQLAVTVLGAPFRGAVHLIRVSLGPRWALAHSVVGIADGPQAALAVLAAGAAVPIKFENIQNAALFSLFCQSKAGRAFAVGGGVIGVRDRGANGILVAGRAEVGPVAHFALSDSGASVLRQLVADLAGASARLLAVAVVLLADRIGQRTVGFGGAVKRGSCCCCCCFS